MVAGVGLFGVGLLGAVVLVAGSVSVRPGRMILLTVIPLAASNDVRLIWLRDAIAYNESPDRTTYVPAPAVGDGDGARVADVVALAVAEASGGSTNVSPEWMTDAVVAPFALASALAVTSNLLAIPYHESPARTV